MTTYDDGRAFAEEQLAAGETREVVATVAGQHAGQAYQDVEDVKEFGFGVLDVLHDKPHRDAQD